MYSTARHFPTLRVPTPCTRHFYLHCQTWNTNKNHREQRTERHREVLTLHTWPTTPLKMGASWQTQKTRGICTKGAARFSRSYVPSVSWCSKRNPCCLTTESRVHAITRETAAEHIPFFVSRAWPGPQPHDLLSVLLPRDVEPTIRRRPGRLEPCPGLVPLCSGRPPRGESVKKDTDTTARHPYPSVNAKPSLSPIPRLASSSVHKNAGPPVSFELQVLRGGRQLCS